jgi:outer membrane lipoprotein carrier protein
MIFNKLASVALGAVLAVAAGSAAGGAVDEFRAFTAQAKSARGEFTQVVSDRTGKVLRQSSGTFSLARPGKFRWSYTKPYSQLLVGDGEKVWVYDADLNPVTVRSDGQGRCLRHQRALLSGSHGIREGIHESRVAASRRTELARREADQRRDGTRLGEGSASTRGRWRRLVFVEPLRATTTITVSKLDKNPQLAADTFTFVRRRAPM